MSWPELRAAFLEAVTQVADLLDQVEDWDEAALGEWTVAGLAGHLTRAVAMTARYLAEPAPASPDLPGAAEYYRAYLQAGEPGRRAVAQRGRDEAAALALRRLPEAYRTALAGAEEALGGTQAERMIATPYGALRLDEYLRTRILEVTVHGLDLAHAARLRWRPPSVALATTLSVLHDLVLLDLDRAAELVLLATGRPWVKGEDVLPLLA